MANTTLKDARKAKNDEFYTQLSDIEKELRYYKAHFEGKTVLCNCDDPRVSQFFYYFFANFHVLGVKRLIATCYKNTNPDLFSQNLEEQAVYCIYEGAGRADDRFTDYDAFIKQNEWQVLKGDGDFRSAECVELLKEADIVVTNPPFSLFREYVAQLIEYGKKFIIIGSMNAITYKETFKLIQENKMWLGYNNGPKWFGVPSYYTQKVNKVDEEGNKFTQMGNTVWFTNINHPKRNEKIILYKDYDETEFPRYDNYDAIEVSKVSDIPKDYYGVMGVPITFLDKYNPEQFEVLGQTGVIDPDDICIEYKGGRPYIKGSRLYARILIKRSDI